ncbi:MAG: endonuclease/exonuclease/phosphatase family protein [bacterium]|nr:endonuclease/exonuclease/phosphatase family protein [bacterium]
MKRRFFVWVAACILLFSLTLSLPSMPTTAQGTAPTAAEPVRITVMTYNILYGGDEIDYDQMLEAIRVTDPDIIGLQEPMGNVWRIAADLGYPYGDERMHIISKFPLLTPPDFDGSYTFIEVAPGQVMAMANVHLTSDPYGPYLVRDGEPLDAVLALEQSLRLPEIGRYVEVLPNLVEMGYPVVWVGDFNSPSHLDWTPAADEARDVIAYPVTWPVSSVIAQMGFIDTYRTAHPDPVARPGFTWTPALPPIVEPDEVPDRIDWVLAGGNVRVIDSAVVGEAENPAIVDVVVDPYGSDHRAVISTLEVVPAAPPTLAASERPYYTVGDPVTIRYSLPEGSFTLSVEGGSGDVDVFSASVNGHGAVTLPEGLAADVYTVTVRAGGEDAPRNTVAASSFRVRSGDETPTIRVDGTQFLRNDVIRVEFADAPGNRLDWVGIYTAGDADLENYWLFRYTGAATDGTLMIGDTLDQYDGFPLEPGEYVARLMLDDDYITLAESDPFTVGP